MPVLLATLIGVISTGLIPLMTYFGERNSHTVIKVTGSDANHVYVKVWNTGRKPSALVGYRMKFDKLPAKETALELDEVEQRTMSVIEPQKHSVTISLSPPRKQDLSDSRLNIQYTSDDIGMLVRKEKALSDVSLTIEVDVQESDDTESGHQTRRERLRADRISKFIPRLMP